MWGDMSLWNVQGPLLHSGDHIVPRILRVDYTFNMYTACMYSEPHGNVVRKHADETCFSVGE